MATTPSGFENLKGMAKKTVWSITPPILAPIVRRLRHGPEPEGLIKSRQRIQSDEYINWLCVVLGGWLSPGSGNLAAFDYAVCHMPAGGAVVEIGSFLGLSTNIIAYLLQKYKRENPLFSADPWMFEGTEKPIGGYFDASTEAYRAYAKEVFRMSVALFSANRRPFAIEATSDRFFELWNTASEAQDVFDRKVRLGGKISFAYIDGAHTYEATRTDFLNVDRHLLPGGYILLDDTSNDVPFESKQVAAEVSQNPSYELVFKTPHYFFRKRS